jgi:hypothetical protein
MALCTRCGQETEAGAEVCIACDGYLTAGPPVGAYSGAADRNDYLPGSRGVPWPPDDPQAWTGHRNSIDPAWYAEDYPGERGSHAEPGVSRHGRTSPDRRDSSAMPSGAHGGRWIAIAASAVVVCIAAVAAVLLSHHGGAGHRRTTSRPASSPAASRSRPTPDGVVTIDPSAASAPQEAAVVAVLNRYFSAINSHAYNAYEKLFSPAVRTGLSPATFMSGFGTTRDSAETLHSIGVIGAGQVEAVVTFTSHQQAAASPTRSSCTAWRISLYLIRQGRRYLLAAPPPGYQASFHSCP